MVDPGSLADLESAPFGLLLLRLWTQSFLFGGLSCSICEMQWLLKLFQALHFSNSPVQN